MKRAWRAWLACALAVAPGAAVWAADRPAAAIVIALAGKPELRAKGQSSFKRLRMGEFVREGDTLRTGRHEQVSIAFTNNVEFRMNENSTFEVQSSAAGDQPAKVSTKLGQAWTRHIGKIIGESAIRVKTPMAVAAVRGTEADIDYDSRLAVKVYEGLVDVENDKGKQSLQAGQMTTVASAGQAPETPRAMTDQDRATWQNGLRPQNVEDSLDKLNKEADRTRVLRLQGKDGKVHEIHKKKP